MSNPSSISSRVFVTLISSVVGLGISIYLTLAHFTDVVSLTCPLGSKGGIVDCAKVTTSPQSYVFGIPVAVLGLVYFISMTLLSTPWAWRAENRFIAPLRLGSTVVSVGFISYLLYCELYVIHSICIWCSVVHFFTLVIFIAVVTGWDEATLNRVNV
ncbi:MAG TPA: vitamin K epoxide reductase family protein [Acidimicrobiales bacterium]|nr:vitamin K epoxide reductase family protein [Acidimicrobiales bacterium]